MALIEISTLLPCSVSYNIGMNVFSTGEANLTARDLTSWVNERLKLGPGAVYSESKLLLSVLNKCLRMY